MFKSLTDSTCLQLFGCPLQGAADVLRFDQETGHLLPMSAAADGSGTADDDSIHPAISAGDGTILIS